VSLSAAESIARAVLYEGYALYPYRASSVKNRHRWMFGTLTPAGGAAASAMRTECLALADDDAEMDVLVRFLHLVDRDGSDAREREVRMMRIELRAAFDHERAVPFSFEPSDVGMRALRGTVAAHARRLAAGVYKIVVDVTNETRAPQGVDAELVSLMSTHTVLAIAEGSQGELCSLTDPPPELAQAAAGCRNIGTWPALIAKSTVLSSPIILPDFPEVAPESPGDLFDGTEIDEILTLRILTLSDAEKAEIRRAGGRTAELLDRTLALGESDIARLHGALRQRSSPLLAPGDSVTLHPSRRADVMDIALRGKRATVVSLEEDFEGQSYVTVTVDDDPGRDLGREGKPGHRFFFRVDEVERAP
jgi:hypothetical protein